MKSGREVQGFTCLGSVENWRGRASKSNKSAPGYSPFIADDQIRLSNKICAGFSAVRSRHFAVSAIVQRRLMFLGLRNTWQEEVGQQ